MAQVLIVDDDVELCRLVADVLRGRGHAAHFVHSGEEALCATRGEREYDVVLLDVQLPGMDGIETLHRLRVRQPTLPVIIVTGFNNVATVVRAMKLGANDVLMKPVDHEHLLRSVEQMVAARSELRRDAPAMVGSSKAFRKCLALARRFAAPDINVVLIGETGTGKELFARAIHTASRRSAGPFVAVDCSTLAESLIESELFGHEKGSFTGATESRIGRFELAQGGTLFLDEIGNLPIAVQAKLLRVLQTRQMERVGGRDPIKLDVRVVAATNVNLEEAIAAGRFRPDLYFRLQEVMLHVPPLRERDGDIRAIAEHFAKYYAQRFELPVRGVSEAALEILARYEWPGNVRELENAVKSAVVLAGDMVMPEDLPAPILKCAGVDVAAAKASDGGQERLRFEFEVGLQGSEVDLKALGARAAEQAERSVLAALIRHGSRSHAHLAKILSVDPKTLRLKLRRYGLDTVVDGRRAPAPALASPQRSGSQG
jgi:DNA-binding NtrC family response regulator